MIVTCPVCATTYELSPEAVPADGSVIRCAACGHSWLESSALEIRDMDLIAGDVHLADNANMLEAEAARLAEEALAAEQTRRARRARRAAETRRWAALAFAVAALGALLWAFPAQVTRLAPGAERIYRALGVRANAWGFGVSGLAARRSRTASGQTVLAVTGRIENITRAPRRPPALVFILRDAQGRKLHRWVLPAASGKSVPAGAPARFITRIAAPPAQGRRVEVHFLRKS